MTIEGTCQSEMPRTLHTVPCLPHAAQRKPADHGLLRGSRNICQQLLYFLGMYFFGANLCSLSSHGLHIVAEIVDDGGQLPDPIPIRHIVSSIHKGQFQPVKMLSHCLVCRQHKILDDIRGHISLIRSDLRRMSLRIQTDLALGKIKVNGSSFPALFPQNSRQLLHQPEHGKQFCVLTVVFFLPFRLTLCQTFLLQKRSYHSI